MTDEISYFDETSFLAEIGSGDIGDPVARTEWLIGRLQQKWPTLSVSQAVAYIQLFESGRSGNRSERVLGD